MLWDWFIPSFLHLILNLPGVKRHPIRKKIILPKANWASHLPSPRFSFSQGGTGPGLYSFSCRWWETPIASNSPSSWPVLLHLSRTHPSPGRLVKLKLFDSEGLGGPVILHFSPAPGRCLQGWFHWHFPCFFPLCTEGFLPHRDT